MKPAPAPPWFIEMHGAPPPRRSRSAGPPVEIDQGAARQRAAEYLAGLESAVQGTRNHEAYKAACKLRDLGLDEPCAAALMVESWRAEPALNEEEVERVVGNAYRYAQGDAGQLAPETHFKPIEPPAVPGAPAKPSITLGEEQASEEVGQAWRAVAVANDPRPTLFVRRGKLVHLATSRSAPPAIELVSADWLYGHLLEIATWHRNGKGGKVASARPSPTIARVMLARPASGLPQLEAVGTVPVFTGDGSLLTAPGYHSAAAYYLHLEPGGASVGPPELPTEPDVTEARRLICEEVLGDFRFVSEADRAHAVAAMLIPLVRRLIDGCTPLHVFEAPTPGSGKGLLAAVVSIIASGSETPPRSLPTTEDEIRKTITTELAAGRPIILLDNARDGVPLDSAAFAAVLTAQDWKDRLLGATANIESPNNALWILTGNNPTFSKELARRCIRVRIDTKEARPWLTSPSSWRHSDLKGWVQQRRTGLLRALLTLAQSWLHLGRPAPVGLAAPLGGFEKWSFVIGGILEAASIPGFLGNLMEMYAANDQETREWEAFVEAWRSSFLSEPVTVDQLVHLCNGAGLMTTALGAGNERSQQSKMGRALRNARDKVFRGLTISEVPRATGDEHRKRYVLTPAVAVGPRAHAAGGGVGTMGTSTSEVPMSESEAQSHSPGQDGDCGDYGDFSYLGVREN